MDEEGLTNFSFGFYEIFSYDGDNFTNGTDYFQYLDNNTTGFGYVNETDFELTFTHKFIDFLSHYYVPVLVVFGVIGNILSAIAFLITKLKKISSCYYITALSVSDTIILIDAFLQWLSYIDINIYNQNYFCQVFAFASRSAYFTSIWLVVAFTVERFIAVLHPLKRQTMCTARRACLVVIGLTLLSCATRIPFIFIFAPVYTAHFDIIICGSDDVNHVRLLFFR